MPLAAMVLFLPGTVRRALIRTPREALVTAALHVLMTMLM
jgi:hypothetical protein